MTFERPDWLKPKQPSKRVYAKRAKKNPGYHRPTKRDDCDCTKCPPIHVFYKAWCDGCAKNHMSYKDYIKATAERAAKGPDPYLAPATAFPHDKAHRAINVGWLRKIKEQREIGRYVRTVDIELTRYGNLQRSDIISLCKKCYCMTKTTRQQRCGKCHAYKPKEKRVESEYAQAARGDTPIYQAGSPGRVGDSQEHPVEGSLVETMKPKLCKVCHNIHLPKEACK